MSSRPWAAEPKLSIALLKHQEICRCLPCADCSRRRSPDLSQCRRSPDRRPIHEQIAPRSCVPDRVTTVPPAWIATRFDCFSCGPVRLHCASEAGVICTCEAATGSAVFGDVAPTHSAARVTPREQRAESRHEKQRRANSKHVDRVPHQLPPPSPTAVPRQATCVRSARDCAPKASFAIAAVRGRSSGRFASKRVNCQREWSRNVLSQSRQRRRGRGCLFDQQRRLQWIDERRATREHFVQQNSETVEIAARADALSQTLLGRHVARRSDQLARTSARVCSSRFSRRSQNFRDAEIEHANAALAEQDV